MRTEVCGGGVGWVADTTYIQLAGAGSIFYCSCFIVHDSLFMFQCSCFIVHVLLFMVFCSCVVVLILLFKFHCSYFIVHVSLIIFLVKINFS